VTIAFLELRRLARSPILWLGIALVTLGAMPDIFAFWPLLEGNDLIAHDLAHDLALWFMSFSALAAGWLGLRDRRTGAHALVGVTPADAAASIVPARIAALLLASLTAFALVFGAALAVTLLRGGGGTPDLRLYLDGALLVALGANIGYGLGYLTRSRAATLFAAPGLPALNQLALSIAFVHPDLGPAVDWAWLLPSVYEPQRSVTFGFVPDIWTGHIAWLAALVALVCGGLTLSAARRARARRALVGSMTLLLLAIPLAGFSGAWLISRPHSVVVLGPDTVLEIHEGDDFFRPALTRMARAIGPWPDDERTACATSQGFEACAYPEFGEEFAREMASEYAQQARLLSGLDDFPTRARMVPYHWTPLHPCSSGELLYSESRASPLDHAYGPSLLECSWPPTGHSGWGAREAVTAWLFAEAHPEMRAELAGGRISFGSRAITRAGLAMAGMSPEDVRDLLSPMWDDLRRGTLPLSALPGSTG
jgi:hypothetical protein